MSRISSTTDEQAYIVSLETRERLPIQYIPQQIDWERQAHEQAVNIVGRNIPYHHFTGGERSLPLKLDFFAVAQLRDDVLEKIRWLEALTYSQGIGTTSQRVKVIMGELFRDEVWVVKSVKPRIKQVERRTFYPVQAEVDVLLEQESRQGDVIRSDVEGTKKSIE